MTIGDLKKSLSRMSPDMDDCEVFINYINSKDELDYDYLAFTSYMELPENETVVYVLGSEKAAYDRLKKGILRYPDGSIPPVD